MINNIILCVLALSVLFVVGLTVVLVVRYISCRDKGSFRVVFKIGSFEFLIDSTAEKFIKKN